MPILRRTHTCGELRAQHAGQTVVLNGWVNTYRNQGAVVFVDLRDRYGKTQVIFEADKPELVKAAQDLRTEFCVAVKGKVEKRLAGKERADLATGAIEVKAEELVVFNRCPTPPFEVSEMPGVELANEDLRLQYRYLDLRRPSLQRVLSLRHTMIKAIRDHLSAQGFLEIETPFLGRSTPEGARDYLVPSRITPGCWYALPQSPQLYKQLLMVAGYDKYFQIARCMRDEDLRADRQPEFTQLDFEMSFVEQDDVLTVIKELSAEILRQCLGVDVPLPFPGLAWVKVEAEKLTSPIEKFLPAASQQKLRDRLAAKPGDLLLFVADAEDTVAQALGALRGELARRLGLVDPARKDFKFAWIVDF